MLNESVTDVTAKLVDSLDKDETLWDKMKRYWMSRGSQQRRSDARGNSRYLSMPLYAPAKVRRASEFHTRWDW